MKKITPYLLVFVCFAMLASCSKADSAQTGSAGNEGIYVENQDSSANVAKDSSAAGKAATDSVVKKKEPNLATTDAQIDYMKESGSWDKYESGILPQMAEDAPEYCEKILKNGKKFIIVDKAKMKLFLYDPKGNILKSCGIACAKNYGTKHKKGDSRTTEGIFNVKGVFDSREWLFTNDEGYTSPAKGVYGPRFIRLNIPYIGIHGTSSPGSIGKRCSHGCIRVTNDNIMDLVKYVEEGMNVIISPGPRDMAVNKRENTRVLAVATEPGTPKAVAGNAPAVSQSSSAAPAKKEIEEEKPVEPATDAAPQQEAPAEPESQTNTPAQAEPEPKAATEPAPQPQE